MTSRTDLQTGGPTGLDSNPELIASLSQPVSAEEVVLVGRVLVVAGGVAHPRHLRERLAARAEEEARGDVGLARREGARCRGGVRETLLGEVLGHRDVGAGVGCDLQSSVLCDWAKHPFLLARFNL